MAMDQCSCTLVPDGIEVFDGAKSCRDRIFASGDANRHYAIVSNCRVDAGGRRDGSVTLSVQLKKRELPILMVGK